MKETINALSSFEPYILVGLVIVVLILFIMNIMLFRSLNKVEKRYRKLTRGVNNKNLEELIISYLDRIDGVNTISEEIKRDHEQLENRIKSCIQKVSMVRYKAFDDVGSDLSFSLALLNDNNDGLILTGIYGRDDSIVYAKPIDKGICRYDLSEEEKEVLYDACNKFELEKQIKS